MKFLLLSIFCLLATSQALRILQDGKEYEYKTTITNAAGTMDVATHSSGEQYKMKVRIQVTGNTLNVKISDLQRSMYVGGHLPTDDPYTKTRFEPVTDVLAIVFAVNLDSNGLVQSVTIPSGMTTFQKNIVKGWAAQLQINTGAAGKGAFKSKEKSLHGECEYSYSATKDMIVKSVSHMADCANRNYRFLDDWRGYRCNMDFKNPAKKTSTDGLFSSANTVYVLDKQGGIPVISSMTTTSSLVSQMYEEEGFSHFAYVKVVSNLAAVKGSSRDIIVPGGITLSTLDYEFSDAAFKWDKSRNLKDREPFLSSGVFYEDSQATLKATVLKLLDTVSASLHAHGIDQATIQKNHKYGLEALYFPLYAMDYDTLKATALELLADKSDLGKQKSNMFNEFLGNTGTSASALVVRDLIMADKFDNDRDAFRILTSVPFHIRRPNKDLVVEFEKLLNWGGASRFLKMSIPLAFGNLVRTTCMRAPLPEQQQCFGSFASKYVDKFWQDYLNAGTRDDKYLALEAMQNIKFGGQAAKVKDLLLGKLGHDAEFRATAVWVAGWDAFFSGAVDYYMPIFANQKDDHEVRINALAMIMYSKPSTTDLSRIITILKTEKDYEVINMAYALLDQFSNSIDPCNADTAAKAKFFLKYMKQFSRYETAWGFGVSKSFVREFQQNKYGYGGSYHYWVVGSHKSTTPLVVGMSAASTFAKSYQSHNLHINLRIEGLAKGLIRKFKTMDPGTWKTQDLEKILKSDMNIRERPDQPVHVKITLMVKGAVVFSRCYDETSASQGGKLSEFFKGISDMGNEYKINHQRIMQWGAIMYEQPSEIGLPVAYLSSSTVSGHLKATVKRGNLRGLIFRNFDYDINILANAHAGMLISNPGRKLTYSIFQSRLYHIHAPRKVVIGVNPIRKELKISISRPTFDDPAMWLMHSQHIVTVKGTKIGQPVAELAKHCPGCQERTVVSRGAGQAQGRIVRDYENEKFGYYNHAEYFDCEMDIAAGNTRSRALLAFMPFNKNPKSLGASLSLGLRQIAAYIALYPRAERCGIFTRWSQSKVNPTTDFDISIRGSSEEKGARMFFRGRKTTIRILFKANGQPAARAYRASISVESQPAGLQNKIKIQINRAPVPAVGITPYTICAAYESKYPDFAKEFMAVDINQKMAVQGRAMVQYGEGTECAQGEGEIQVQFKHETADTTADDIKGKWYYKKCMEQKAASDWAARGGNKLPPSEPCYMTLRDATNARKYFWDVKFVKLTNRMKNIITNARSIIQAGLIPYYDEDPDADTTLGGNDVGPFMKINVLFKNADKSADLKIQTSQGTREYKDYPLKLEWTNRLRNLRLTSTIRRLINMGIIYPCVATVGTVQTNDNVTYPYQAGSCWTLTSGHCGPNPAYAVFSKKVGNKLAVRAYFGGHSVEVSPSGAVSINGSPKSLTDGKEEAFTHNDVEIFKIVKWGSTVNVYSFLKVWIATDNVFVQVMPAPSTRGQHCGLCGTFNRNIYDEWLGKDGQTAMTSAADLVNEWKWKC